MPILRGRAFDDHDTATTPLVIVISEDVARRIFGATDVVGRQMRYVGPEGGKPRSMEVIGVARDTNSRALDLILGTVYVPLAQEDAQRILIVGRVAGDPAPMVRTFAGIVRQADPDLAVEFAWTGCHPPPNDVREVIVPTRRVAGVRAEVPRCAPRRPQRPVRTGK